MNKVMTNGFCELNENEMTTVDGGTNYGMCATGISYVAKGCAMGITGVAMSIITQNPSIAKSSSAAAKGMVSMGMAIYALGVIS